MACETAIHLAKQGKQVLVLERGGEIVKDAYRLHKYKVREIIRSSPLVQVAFHCNFKKITRNKVFLALPPEEMDGKGTFFRQLTPEEKEAEGLSDEKGAIFQAEAEVVYSALGRIPNDTSGMEAVLQKKGIPYEKIGDCVKARKIYDAVTEGFLAVSGVENKK